MIPRHQAVLLLVLVMASAILGGVLWHLRDRTHEHLLTGEDSAPTHAPQVAPLEKTTLLVASDADNSLQTRYLSLPLPTEPDARARAILDKLLELYAAPDAAHPLPGGAGAIAQVFLIPAGGVDGGKPVAANAAGTSADTGPELAVVSLTGTFAVRHPSGLETETLTVLSICATLHANLPRVVQVRFLVDGQARTTLAGHADLTRTYLAGESVTTEGARP